MLKNPWSHLRWKGNFSEKDHHHWTSELQNLLNYDPKSAQMQDNGEVFNVNFYLRSEMQNMDSLMLEILVFILLLLLLHLLLQQSPFTLSYMDDI